MKITFENDNNVIVYVLEMIISYARENKYIFLAQSIWRISSIIGFQADLVSYIDKLRINLPAPEDRYIIQNKEITASAHPCN